MNIYLFIIHNFRAFEINKARNFIPVIFGIEIKHTVLVYISLGWNVFPAAFLFPENGVFSDKLLDDLYRRQHLFNDGVLVRSVHRVNAGSQIRARKSHERQSRAVRH